MPIASMTGFARSEGQLDGMGWSWELKSVNGRALDVRCRLPAGYDSLEAAVRTRSAERLVRGHVSAQLSLTRGTDQVDLRINGALLEKILAAVATLPRPEGVEPARLDGLLGLRGVIEVVEAEETTAERAARETAMLESFETALDGLVAVRGEEGRRLAAILGADLDALESLAGAARAAADAQAGRRRERLAGQVGDLLQDVPPLPPERLAQEVALLLVKADVSEEIERLGAHVEAARALLAEGGAVGRRFDFLCQELNREANTMCAKAIEVDLTRIGLDLKAVIDRLREQIQNVE